MYFGSPPRLFSRKRRGVWLLCAVVATIMIVAGIQWYRSPFQRRKRAVSASLALQKVAQRQCADWMRANSPSPLIGEPTGSTSYGTPDRYSLSLSLNSKTGRAVTGSREFRREGNRLTLISAEFVD